HSVADNRVANYRIGLGRLRTNQTKQTTLLGTSSNSPFRYEARWGDGNHERDSKRRAAPMQVHSKEASKGQMSSTWPTPPLRSGSASEWLRHSFLRSFGLSWWLFVEPGT